MSGEHWAPDWAVLAAFPAETGGPAAPPARADLAHALNRVSSALYLLACSYVAGLYEGSRRPKGPVRGWHPPAAAGGKKEAT